MKHLVVLWDVDGTLMTMNGGTWEPFYAAVVKVTKRPYVPYPDEHPLHGTTDRHILTEFFKHNGVNQEEMPAALEEAFVYITEEMADPKYGIAQKGFARKGAKEVVAAIGKAHRTIQTVLTGNVRGNAEWKLKTFGVAEGIDFDLGAYGSETAVRAELVDISLNKVCKTYGLTRDDLEVWIVGDTKFDLLAAHANGIKGALVGGLGGTSNYDELANLQPRPDAMFKTFEDVTEVVGAIGNIHGPHLALG